MEENNNQNNENNPIQEDKVKKPLNVKMIATIIVVIIFIIVAISAGIYIFNSATEEDDDDDDKKSDTKISLSVYEDDNDNDYDYEDDEYYDDYAYTDEELDELEENLVTKKVGETEYGEFVISIKNNNDEMVCIDDVYVIFRDEDGAFLSKSECMISYFAIAANSEIMAYTMDGYDDIPEYDDYEIQIELDEYKDTDYMTVENFEISSVDNGKSIAAEVVNNNDFTVSDIELEIIYYRDGEIVGANIEYDSTTVKSGDSAYITLDYAYDSEYEDITDFDDYEIYVCYAYIAE